MVLHLNIFVWKWSKVAAQFFFVFLCWFCLGPPSYGIGTTIRIRRERLCLPYAGFFLGLSLALRSHDQFPASHCSPSLPPSLPLGNLEAWKSPPKKRKYILKIYLYKKRAITHKKNNNILVNFCLFCSRATLHIGQEIQCLSYAGFFYVTECLLCPEILILCLLTFVGQNELSTLVFKLNLFVSWQLFL